MSLTVKDHIDIALHTQFAENQRAKETMFLKVVAFLGVVIIGYASSYQRFFGYFEITFVATVCVLLLVVGSWMVVVIAYSFRRDQRLIFNIRKKIYGNDTANSNGENPFPNDYNPKSIYSTEKEYKKGNFIIRAVPRCWLKAIYKEKKYQMIWIRWMPDIFVVYFILFPIFILLITFSQYVYFYSYVAIVDIENEFYLNLVWLFTSLYLVGFFLTLYLPYHYSSKLLRKIIKWEEELEDYSLFSPDLYCKCKICRSKVIRFLFSVFNK